ncbi:MAG: beta strand repeat-containing protein [Opitutaceae bacterium]
MFTTFNSFTLPLRLFFLAVVFTLSASANTEFTWTDNGGNNNWVNSSNWSQDPGSGDYPGEKEDSEFVVLDGSKWGSGGTNHFDIDLTTSSSVTNHSILWLTITTDGSTDAWQIQNGPQAARISVYGELVTELDGGGSATMENDLYLADGVTWTTSGNKLVLNGALKGSSSAHLFGYQSSGGGITLNSAGDFPGTIFVRGNTLDINHVNAVEYARVDMDPGGTLEYINNTNIARLTGDGALPLTSGLNLNVGGANEDFGFSGNLSGSGTITKVGTGIWSLTSTSTHTGTTYINGGQIRLTDVDALQATTVWVNTNDALDLNGLTANLGALGGAQSIDLGTGSIHIVGNKDTLYLGSISGSGSVIMDGSGIQTLGGTSSYTGGTSILDGTLKASSNANLGNAAGAVTFDDGILELGNGFTSSRALAFTNSDSVATLTIPSGTATWNGLIAGGAPDTIIRKFGAGTLSLANNSNAYDGTLDIDAGVVTLSATAMQHAIVDLGIDDGLSFATAATTVGSLGGTGDLNLGAAQVLTFGGNDDSETYSGDLSGTGSSRFIKTGSGTFVYSGIATLGGTSQLTGGTLQLDGTLNTPMLSDLSSSSGTTLFGTGSTHAGATLILAGDIAPGDETANSIGTIKAGSMVLSGTYLCDLNAATNDQVMTTGVLDIESSDLSLNLSNGAPSLPAYIIAEYGSLSGSEFASVSGLPAGYRVDYAYDDASSTNNIAVILDTVAPTINSITPNNAGPTNADSLAFTVVFDEVVSNFDAFADLSITSSDSATATGASFSNSGATYTVTLTGVSGDGTLALAVNTASDVTDLVGNALASSPTSAAVTIDNTAPSQSSSTTTTPSPTNADSITYTIVFSEPVIGLADAGDFYYTGATTSAGVTANLESINSADNKTYSLTLNGITGDGPLQFRLRANQITDLAGNHLPIDPFNRYLLIDNTAPTVTSITPASTDSTNADSHDFAIVFDESVSNFDTFADLVVSGAATATGATFSGSGDTYTVTLTGISGNGSLALAVNTSSDVTDTAGNALASSPTSSAATIDNIAPTVTSITPASTDSTNADSLAFAIVFDEPVSNFDAFADLVVSGATTATGATFSGSESNYTVTLTGISGDGSLALAVNTSSDVTDSAGNALASSPTSSAVTIDNTAPTVTSITPASTDSTNADSLAFAIVFDEPVSNFDAFADLVVSGATTATGATFSGSGDTYTVTLTGISGDGSIVLAVSTSSDVADSAGNALASSPTSTAVTIDNIAPTVTSITPASTDSTNADSLAFAIVFDEPVSNFDVFADLVVSGAATATGATFSGNGDTYTVTLTGISGDGSLALTVNTSSDVTDSAGNALATSPTSTAVTIDNTAPNVNSISPIGLDPGNIAPADVEAIAYTIVFDEPVINFDAFADLVVSGAATATGATFSGSGDTYTVTLTGISGDGSLTLAVNSASDIVDAAGNALASSLVSATVTIEDAAPTATITTTADASTNANSITYSIAFSEPVSGFVDASDIYFATHTSAATTDLNATVITNSGDDQNYTLTLNNLSGNGLLQFLIKADQITGDSGNQPSSDIASPIRTIDTTPPVLTLNGDATVTVVVGDDWIDPSASGTDNFDLNISVIRGSGGRKILTAIPSTIQLTYDATDAAGNAAQQITRTLIVLSVYDDWAQNTGLQIGVNDGPTDDPDHDGRSNFEEFAFDGNPLSGTPDGNRHFSMIDYGTSGKVIALTLPVRSGANFVADPGGGSLSASVDELKYTIAGSADLESFALDVIEIPVVIDPGTTTPSTGWEYRSFILNQSTDSSPQGFLRAEVEDASFIGPQ